MPQVNNVVGLLVLFICSLIQKCESTCESGCVKDQGTCVRQTFPSGNVQVVTSNYHCVCNEGWSGEACHIPTCRGSSKSCSNHGLCTAPNTCQCLEGWEGPICANQTSSSCSSASGTNTTAVLISLLAMVCLLLVLCVASWNKNGRTSIIYPPIVPDGRTLGPLVSRVITTQTFFLWIVRTSKRQEDYFDTAGCQFVPRYLPDMDPSLPTYDAITRADSASSAILNELEGGLTDQNHEHHEHHEHSSQGHNAEEDVDEGNGIRSPSARNSIGSPPVSDLAMFNMLTTSVAGTDTFEGDDVSIRSEPPEYSPSPRPPTTPLTSSNTAAVNHGFSNVFSFSNTSDAALGASLIAASEQQHQQQQFTPTQPPPPPRRLVNALLTQPNQSLPLHTQPDALNSMSSTTPKTATTTRQIRTPTSTSTPSSPSRPPSSPQRSPQKSQNLNGSPPMPFVARSPTTGFAVRRTPPTPASLVLMPSTTTPRPSKATPRPSPSPTLTQVPSRNERVVDSPLQASHVENHLNQPPPPPPPRLRRQSPGLRRQSASSDLSPSSSITNNNGDDGDDDDATLLLSMPHSDQTPGKGKTGWSVRRSAVGHNNDVTKSDSAMRLAQMRSSRRISPLPILRGNSKNKVAPLPSSDTSDHHRHTSDPRTNLLRSSLPNFDLVAESSEASDVEETMRFHTNRDRELPIDPGSLSPSPTTLSSMSYNFITGANTDRERDRETETETVRDRVRDTVRDSHGESQRHGQ